MTEIVEACVRASDFIETVYIAQLFLPDKINIEGYEKSTVISLILFSEVGKTASGDYSPDYTNAVKAYKPKEEKKLKEILLLGALDGYANNGMCYDYLNLERSTTKNNNINMVICNELKLIHMEYKYYSLYDKLSFDKDRRKEFEEEFKEPHIEICKEIRKKLIRDNPNFKKHFSTHEEL